MHSIKGMFPNLILVVAAAHMSHRNDESGGGDHSHMNGHVELKRSCRVKKSQFEHLNQSLLFDQLVNRSVTPLTPFLATMHLIKEKQEEASGGATDEGYLSQDGQACNRCNMYRTDQHR